MIKKYKYFWMKVFNIIIILTICVVYHNIAAKRTTQMQAVAESTTNSAYKDGTYKGTGTGFGGDILVSVTIKDGKISDIQVLEAKKEDEAYLENATSIIDTMLANQTSDVDVASGATFSSKGIIEATQHALEEANK